MLPLFSFSQVNPDCSDALEIFPDDQCVFEPYVSEGSAMWFKFTATAEDVRIVLVTNKYGLDVPHIHNISLYHSDCDTYMTDTELPFADSTDTLTVDAIALGLQIGEIYYLKADRKAHVGDCARAGCTANQSMDSANFSICVQNLDVILPPAEQPSPAFAYEENNGQLTDMDGNLVPAIKMFANQSVPAVYLADAYTSFVWSKIDTVTATVDTVHRIDMKLYKSLPTNMLKVEKTPGYNNYYLEHTPGGLLNQRSFSRVMRNNIYTDIDMHHYSSADGVKFYFVVKPGGDVNDITMIFEGAASTSITSSGGMRISSALGDLEFKPAEIYAADFSGNYIPLVNSGSFVAAGSSTNGYRFDVESYPATMGLLIKMERVSAMGGAPGDPVWSTYFGGVGEDAGTAITADNIGNTSMVGVTSSTDFPIWGPDIYSDAYSGYVDGFIANFNTGYARRWVTYYGGNDHDYLTDVAYDNSNQATYVSGVTTSTGNTFEVKQLASSSTSYSDDFEQPYPENYRSFFARFDDNGALAWATCFAGEEPRVAVDQNGNVFGGGKLNNLGVTTVYANTPQGNGDFPICYENTDSYRQFSNNGGSGTPSGTGDVYIVKFNDDLELVWSTCFGGSGMEFLGDIVVDDNNGYVYYAGSTESARSSISCASVNNTTGFPLCSQGAYYQNTQTGFDGFISRFTLQGKLDWSTYFGGSGEDHISGIDIDNSGNIAITGSTATSTYGNITCGVSSNGGFPICHPTLAYAKSTYGGGATDAFVATFRKTTQLTWSTFLGGVGEEPRTYGGKLHYKANDELFLIGETQSGSNNTTGSFPTFSNPYYYMQNTHGDYVASGNAETDVFIMGFNTAKTRILSTYFGGSGAGETSGGIVTVGNRVYICGTSLSWPETFPLNHPSSGNPYFKDMTEDQDAFIAQIQVEGADLGISDLEATNSSDEDGILVYPNPNSGTFTVSWNAVSSQKEHIQILNQLGQIIKTEEINTVVGENAHDLQLPLLATGVYFIRISDADAVKMCKMIKR